MIRDIVRLNIYDIYYVLNILFSAAALLFCIKIYLNFQDFKNVRNIK